MGAKSTRGIRRNDAILFLMQYINKLDDDTLARMLEEANDDLQRKGEWSDLGILLNFEIVDNPEEYNRERFGDT